MSGSPPPADAPASPEGGLRCPRCGGVARPHKRRGAWANPFLSKSKTEITCEDCGLDFDPAAPPSDASHPSGPSPWSKP